MNFLSTGRRIARSREEEKHDRPVRRPRVRSFIPLSRVFRAGDYHFCTVNEKVSTKFSRAAHPLRFRLRPRASSWFHDLKSPVSFGEEWRRDGGVSGVVHVRVCPTLSPIVREDTHVRGEEYFSSRTLFSEYRAPRETERKTEGEGRRAI